MAMNNAEYKAWIRKQIEWFEEQQKDHYLTEEEGKALRELREQLEEAERWGIANT
jgi:molybdopterin converting factor small subunit